MQSFLGIQNCVCVFFNLCVYWTCRVFVAALELSPAVVCGLLFATASLVAEYRLWGVWVSVFVACGLRSCSSRAPEHGFTSCGAQG